MSTIPRDQASELRRMMAASGRLADHRSAIGAVSDPSATLPAAVQARTTATVVEPREKSARTTPQSFSVGGRTAPSRSRSACVIAVASGKGGVGKTNIAVNLAICLARRGRRVVLVDADLGTANVDVVMNVKSRYDLSHVIRGQRTIDEIAVPIERGLRLIAGASGLVSVADLSPLERQALIDELGRLESGADIILLDCGAGISQNVLAFAQSADELLVVTTPEPTALTDAYALAKVLSRAPWTPPMHLVVSQTNSLKEGQMVAERVASVAAKFLGLAIDFGGQVLRDQHVSLAVRQRVPFVVKYPDCPASTCITALASRVDASSAESPSRSGFFRRVFRFFY